MTDIPFETTGTDRGAGDLLRKLREQTKQLTVEQKSQNAEARRATTAASNLAGSIKGVIAAYVGLAGQRAAVRHIVQVTIEAEQATLRLEAVIRATGSSAGRTAQQIEEMSTQLAQSSLFDDEAIKQAAGSLMTFRNVQKSVFDEALRMSIDVASVIGKDLPAVAFAVGRALNTPAEAMNTLRAAGIRFTEDQQKVIKAMIDAGNHAGAQTEILNRLRESYGGAGAAMNQGLTGAVTQARHAIDDFFESLGKAQTGPAKRTMDWLTQFFRSRILTDNPMEDAIIAVDQMTTRLEWLTRLRDTLRRGGSIEVTDLLAMPGGSSAAMDRFRELPDVEARILWLNQQIHRSTLNVRAAQAEVGRLVRDEAVARTNAEASANAQADAAARTAREDQARAAALAAQLRMQQQQERLTERVASIMRDVNRDLAEQPRLNDEALRAVQTRLDAAMGRGGVSRRSRLEQEFEDLLMRLEFAGDEAGMRLVRSLINVEAARGEMDDLLVVMQSAQSQLTDRLQEIEQLRQAGLISEGDRVNMMRDAYRQAIRDIESSIDAMERLNAIIGDPAITARIAAMRSELERLKTTLNGIKDLAARLLQEAGTRFRDGMMQVFETFLMEGERIHGFFRQLALDIVHLLRQVAAQALATWAVTRLFDRQGGVIPLPFATGGYVRGPGTTTSDSIPARLSRGEYVMRAAAVERYGPEFFHALNTMQLPPVRSGRRMGFAGGGLVSGGVGMQFNSQATATVQALDPRTMAQLLRTMMPEMAKMNVRMFRESTQFRKAVSRG